MACVKEGSYMRSLNPADRCSFRVNCGGNDLHLNEGGRKVLYEGDAVVDGGSARYYISSSYWGFSSTGDFMDDNNDQNTRFIEYSPSANVSEMYTTARLAPLSLTYFHYCLENGSYIVNLHFAELFFTNDNTYCSLGKRFFDIYIQVTCSYECLFSEFSGMSFLIFL